MLSWSNRISGMEIVSEWPAESVGQAHAHRGDAEPAFVAFDAVTLRADLGELLPERVQAGDHAIDQPGHPSSRKPRTHLWAVARVIPS